MNPFHLWTEENEPARAWRGWVVLGCAIALCLLLCVAGLRHVRADALLPQNIHQHYVALTSVPTSPTDVYAKSVWLLSIELIPQSTTSPTCTVQDKAGTPNLVYNAVSLGPNHSYRDARDPNAPLYMTGGVTWSCTDSTVKAQLVVLY